MQQIELEQGKEGECFYDQPANSTLPITVGNVALILALTYKAQPSSTCLIIDESHNLPLNLLDFLSTKKTILGEAKWEKRKGWMDNLTMLTKDGKKWVELELQVRLKLIELEKRKKREENVTIPVSVGSVREELNELAAMIEKENKYKLNELAKQKKGNSELQWEGDGLIDPATMHTRITHCQSHPIQITIEPSQSHSDTEISLTPLDCYYFAPLSQLNAI